MGISILGLLLSDFNFIFVSLFFQYLPGNYWFLLVGPIVEGSVGGEYKKFFYQNLESATSSSQA